MLLVPPVPVNTATDASASVSKALNASNNFRAVAPSTALRTVDGDDGHRSVAFDKNCACVGHVCAPDRRQHSNGYLLSE
jgi:hypothetical protein